MRNSILLLIFCTYAAYGCTSPPPPPEQPSAHQIPCPEPPKARYTEGAKVQVLWGGTWWDAQVIAVNTCALVKVRFDNYDSGYDEWVEETRIRERQNQQPQTTTIHIYQRNEPVRIDWGGTWYDGVVIEVKPPFYKVRYDGYSETDDAWVSPTRLQRKDNAKPTDPKLPSGQKIEVEWGGHWYPAYVLETNADGKKRIRYEGFSESWDEWVHPRRVRPFRQSNTP